MQCSAWTRKKKRCPIGADRMEKNGAWVCHLHHSEGLFQQQVKANRADRQRKQRLPMDQNP